MSQIIRYHQYWMATLKERHSCHCCGELAINAFEFLSESGICQSVIWHCDEHKRIFWFRFLTNFKDLQRGFS